MRVNKIKGRTLFIDFSAGFTNKPDYDTGREHSYIKHKMMRELDPYCKLIGKPRKYEDPEDLQKAVEDYFNSCLGKTYTKYGTEIIDRDTGKPVLSVVKPYTLSGLARHIGLTTAALKRYEEMALSGRVPIEFAQIIVAAKQRIEDWAEGKCYDRDGSRGAEFILRTGFGWRTEAEEQDLLQRKAKASLAEKEFQLKRDQFELKKKLLDQGLDSGEDDGLQIVITRAVKDDEE